MTNAAKSPNQGQSAPQEWRRQPSPDERSDAGRAARKAVPRSELADIGPADDRDPVGILLAQGEGRVQDLLPIRYGRMVASPFAFYRGAAAVMASDIGATASSGLRSQLCGDAHLSNFGLFASPERRMVFDVNDFDETLPGPFEWDVKRLAASMVIAARQNGVSTSDATDIARASCQSYRESMIDLAGRTDLAVWYQRIDIENVLANPEIKLSKRGRERLSKNIAKARTKDSEQVFAKIGSAAGGRPHIVANPPLIVPLKDVTHIDPDEMQTRIQKVIEDYAKTLVSDRRVLLGRYEMVDFAMKVVGVGSVGTRCWITLMLGRDETDVLFLQVKEASASVLEPYAGKSSYRTAGARVVAGQRLMQASSDIFLGSDRIVGGDGKPRDYYLRQLKDWKGSADVERMSRKTLKQYGQFCGITLARAHARSGDRIAMAAYLGKGDSFDRALARFATDYAARNAKDHAALDEAIDEGRVVASKGI